MAPHPGDFVHQAAPTILERFPASHPRGSWPAEEFAAARIAEGATVTIVMDLATDDYLVLKAGA
jgi:hypothetical protein